MEVDFLQKFMVTGLFQGITNDDDLEKINLAVEKLKTSLDGEVRGQIPGYILAALNQNVPENSLEIKFTEKLLSHHWTSLRLRFPKTPIQLLRGIIIQAIYHLGQKSNEWARLIYLVGSNFLPYATLASEGELIRSMLQELGTKAEKEAVEAWVLRDKIPSIDFSNLPSLPSPSPTKKNKGKNLRVFETQADYDLLKDTLSKAAYDPEKRLNGHQHATSYGEHFSGLAATTISKYVDKVVVRALAESVPDLKIPLQNYAQGLGGLLQKGIEDAFKSLMAAEKRSKLLWWHQTLYSASQNKSYRDWDNPFELTLVMAYDLVAITPMVTPVSVDYLLKEVILIALGKAKAQKKESFDVILDQLEKQAKSLRFPSDYDDFFSDAKTSSKNKEAGPTLQLLVLEFIYFFMEGRINKEEFEKSTGLGLSKTISPQEFAVMLYHDFQTIRLIH